MLSRTHFIVIALFCGLSCQVGPQPDENPPESSEGTPTRGSPEMRLEREARVPASTPARSAPVPVRESRDLAREIERIQFDLQRLETRVDDLSERRAPAGGGSDASARMLRALPDLEPQLEIGSPELEEALHREAGDPIWQGQISEELDAAIRALDLRASRVENVDCRISVCIVQIVHDDLESQEQFYHVVMGVPEFRSVSVQSTEVADGRISMTILVRREQDA